MGYKYKTNKGAIMGFDITGLNPKNRKHKAPTNELYENDQDLFFEELEKYQNQKGAYFRNNVWWWRPLAKRREKIEKHNEQVEKELDNHVKDVQRRMNDSNLAPKDFPKEDHDKWEKIYRRRNSDGSYPFSVENVKEFAEFCEYSGGFSIG